MQLDKSKPFQKVTEEHKPPYFIQNGIRYTTAGVIIDEDEVKAHYASVAAEAQRKADEAMEMAKRAQDEADATREKLGVTKTAVKKAAK